MPDRRSLTDAFVAMLSSVLPDTIKVGLTVAPDVSLLDDGRLQYPYVIVHPLLGAQFSGSLANPEEDADFPYQLTCVGATPQQAQLASDLARVAITARAGSGWTNPITADPVKVIDRVAALGGGPQPDAENVWSVIDHYDLKASTA